MDPLDEMVLQIRSKFKECTSIIFWGELMMMPGEWTFDLARVEQKGASLLVGLRRRDDGSARTVEVSEPSGVAVDRVGRLRIENAAFLKLDEAVYQRRKGDMPPALTLE